MVYIVSQVGNNRPVFQKAWHWFSEKFTLSIDTIFANEKQVFKKQQKTQPAVFNAFEYTTFFTALFILLSTPQRERALQYSLYLGIAKAYCNGSF